MLVYTSCTPHGISAILNHMMKTLYTYSISKRVVWVLSWLIVAMMELEEVEAPQRKTSSKDSYIVRCTVQPNLLDCKSRLQLGWLAVRGSQHPGYVVIAYIVSFLALLSTEKCFQTWCSALHSWSGCCALLWPCWKCGSCPGGDVVMLSTLTNIWNSIECPTPQYIL